MAHAQTHDLPPQRDRDRDRDRDRLDPDPAPTSHSSSSALRAFAHLPSYEFDYDYRGHTIRAPAFDPPLLDTFDSYMFPESDSQSSPTDPSVPSSEMGATDHDHEHDHDHDHDHERGHEHGHEHEHEHEHEHDDDDATTTTTTHHTLSNNASSSSSSSAQAPQAPNAPPQLPPVDWHAVDDAVIYSPHAAALDPCHLYTGYSTYIVLIFVPRQAVELCALVYAKLAHLLHQSSARLVFITAWTPDQATTFLSRFERVTPFPGSVVCDPEAALFSAFGLTRSPLKALFAANRVSAPMRQGMRNALSTVSYRAQNRDIATTPVSSKRLKVGAVVLSSLRGYAKRPNVSYAAEESSLTGTGCYMDVLSACGVNEAFVPDIDVAQLYTRFNSMRTTSMKARHADEKEANRMRTGHNVSRSSRKNDRRNALKS